MTHDVGVYRLQELASSMNVDPTILLEGVKNNQLKAQHSEKHDCWFVRFDEWIRFRHDYLKK